MNITIVSGFFLPVPPVAGGAMEKTWWRLGRIYAARGHRVTHLSRSWSSWPDAEWRDGVQHIRLPGFNHRRRLWQNLVLDAFWGSRVLHALPPADILITNTVALPVFVRRLRPAAGRLVVNLNRYPKGQLRWYGQVARVQAASRAIADAACREAPRLASSVRVVPNPIEAVAIAAAGQDESSRASETITVGFFGRLHPEKGLVRLVEAAQRLHATPGLPRWRLVLRGPADVPRGGGGEPFIEDLRSRGAALAAADRLRIEPPLFDAVRLHRAYHDLDIFCYPSVAEAGETFGVAVVEAMAAGLPVVVSDLECFADHVTHERNGLVVPRAGDDPAGALAAALRRLIVDAAFRRALGNEAAHTVSSLDDAAIADQHLADYADLLHASVR
ncbi:MAG TPA: glycosyltransferase family 4 protein [Opitutaceae bacterium]